MKYFVLLSFFNLVFISIFGIVVTLAPKDFFVPRVVFVGVSHDNSNLFFVNILLQIYVY